MKNTLTPQIDVISVTPIKDGFLVAYWDEAFDGENNVEMQISEEALLTHIADAFPLQDVDFEYPNDNKSFLADNRDEVIKDYIISNS